MSYEEMARQYAKVPQDRLSGVFQELLGSKRQSQPSLRGLDSLLGTGTSFTLPRKAARPYFLQS